MNKAFLFVAPLLAIGLLLLMPLIPRGTQQLTPQHPIVGDKPVVLAYFGFVGCNQSCPRALNAMAQLDTTISTSELMVLDRVFVDLAGEVNAAQGKTYLGAVSDRLRYLPGSQALSDELASRFSLRLFPGSSGEPWHANAFVLAEVTQTGDWQASLYHGKLPLESTIDALQRHTQTKAARP